MKNIEDVINELLEDCCQKCVQLYNELLEEQIVYEDLFYMRGVAAKNSSDQVKVEELWEIVKEIEKYCFFTEEEAYEEKVAQKEQLENIKQRLGNFSV